MIHLPSDVSHGRINCFAIFVYVSIYFIYHVHRFTSYKYVVTILIIQAI